MRILICITLFLSICIWSFECSLIASEQRLVENIFTNYSKSIRPEPVVNVFITIDTKKIVSIDEKNQIMTASFYIGQAWEDPRLAWNSSLYDNITLINIPAKDVWLPDIYVINTADIDGYLPITDSTYITLNKDGFLVLITPLVTANTRCHINTYSFPFDSQKCSIVISPWSHSKSKVSLIFVNDNQTNTDFNNYEPNAIWDLVNIGFDLSSTDDRVYKGNENSTIDRINCTLYLKRKSKYYVLNAILPSVIYNVIILLAFFFPFSDQLNICKLLSIVSFTLFL
jgi:nicotinic acetylcholine receptor, invertebrate